MGVGGDSNCDGVDYGPGDGFITLFLACWTEINECAFLREENMSSDHRTSVNSQLSQDKEGF